MIDKLLVNHEVLARYPQLGERYQVDKRSIRRFTVGKYVTFYEEAPDGIMINRVLHGARKLEDLC